jgi:SAM-dependent methyltransferase
LSSVDPAELNRANWEERALIHARDKTGFYRIAEFEAGGDTLTAIESAELRDVSGLRILHLQCHLGLDSLSLVRRGAYVTGLDFSSNAIAFARKLSSATGLDATFVEAGVENVRGAVAGDFDLVFATWGVLCWIPDARRWFGNAASMLAPGGRIYLADDHPAAVQTREISLADGGSPILIDEHSAIVVDELWRTTANAPLTIEEQHAYTGDTTILEHATTAQWLHPLSEILAGLLEAGLALEFFHEHDRLPYRRYKTMESDGSGLWRLPAEMPGPPLAFSLMAMQRS